MRLAIFINIFCFSILISGQDNLQIDTTLKTKPFSVVDSAVADSVTSTVKEFKIKAKKKMRKVKRASIKNKPYKACSPFGKFNLLYTQTEFFL